MKAWQRIDDGKDIKKVGYRTVVEKVFLMNDGDKMHASIGSPDGAKASIIIALTPDKQVVLARQFRCGPERVMEELPGGLVDPGETPEESAHRELREEVGYDSDEFEYLGNAFINAWDNMVHYFYLATNCYQIHDGEPEKFEEIEIAKISIDQLITNAKTGKMTDIQAVMFAYDKLQAIKEDS